MRLYRRWYGKYKGEYKIYENPVEWKNSEDSEGRNIYKWGEFDVRELKTGDWIEALDGYVIQVLKVTPIGTGSQIRWWITFPNGTSIVYWVESKKRWHWYRYFAQFTTGDYTKMTGGSRVTNGYTYFRDFTLDDTKRKQFGMMVARFVPPYVAYKEIYGKTRDLTLATMTKEILKLMCDEIVKDEVDKVTKTFLKKLREDDDPLLSDEGMTNYIKDFMRFVRKGSKTHLESIEPMLKLLGKLPEEYNTIKANNKQIAPRIEDANEIPPV